MEDHTLISTSQLGASFRLFLVYRWLRQNYCSTLVVFDDDDDW